MYSERAAARSSGALDDDLRALLSPDFDNSFDSFLRPSGRPRPHDFPGAATRPPAKRTPADDLDRLLQQASPGQLAALAMDRTTSSEWKNSFQSVLSKFAQDRAPPAELRLASDAAAPGWFASLPRSGSALLGEAPTSTTLKKSASGHDLRSTTRSPSPLEALRELRIQASGITENLSMLELALLNAESAKPLGSPAAAPLPSPSRSLTLPILRENIQASFNKAFVSPVGTPTSSDSPTAHSTFLSSKLEQLHRQRRLGSDTRSPDTPTPVRRAPLNFTELNAIMDQAGGGLTNGGSFHQQTRTFSSSTSLNFSALDEAAREVMRKERPSPPSAPVRTQNSTPINIVRAQHLAPAVPLHTPQLRPVREEQPVQRPTFETFRTSSVGTPAVFTTVISRHEAKTKALTANLLSEVDNFLGKSSAVLGQPSAVGRTPGFPLTSTPLPVIETPPPDSPRGSRHSPSPDWSLGRSSPGLLPQPRPKHHFREAFAQLGLEPRSPRGLGPPTPAFPWAMGASGSVAERVSRFEKFPVVDNFHLGSLNTIATVVRTRPELPTLVRAEPDPPSLLTSVASIRFQQPATTIQLQPAPVGKKISNASVVISRSEDEAPAKTLPAKSVVREKATAQLILSPRNGQTPAARHAEPPSPRPHGPPGLPKPGSAAHIPRFHFPGGRPGPSGEGGAEAGLAAVAALPICASGKPHIRLDHMPDVVAALGLPLYWKKPVFLAAGGAKGHISYSDLSTWWKSVCAHCHDEAARFVAMLKGPRNLAPLSREDFEPMIQDIVDTFPGLYFLREAPDFHSRYVQTVIARIFFSLNRSWSGRISLAELRHSNFLHVVRSLETVEDINSVTEYFSYEHFYVIYCKFWDIDLDHDLLIDRADLARHESGCLTPRIIDRIFSGAVRPAGAAPDRLSYTDFVVFLVAEEDKRQPTSLEYWFRCLDLDGDGVLSLYELEWFYADVAAKMEGMGVEPMDFANLICELLDIVKPERAEVVTLRDLKRCGMGNYFFNSFVNLHKHYEQESEGTDKATLRKENGEEMSEWERYCADEYEALMAADAAEEEADDDDEDPDRLSSSAPEAGLRGSQPFPLDAL